MANQKCLDVLEKGVGEWNSWRETDTSLEPDLSDANLKEAALARANLKNANLRGADLSGAVLDNADLEGANLQRTRLVGTSLNSTMLNFADLTEADLTEAYVYKTYLYGAILREAILVEASLIGALPTHANFLKANLKDANLSDSCFDLSDLSQASLTGANLARVSLRGASLRDADLTRTFLAGTIFSGTDLTNADLAAATLNATIFSDVDLRSVRGLAETVHLGPSTIGLDTIFRSHGKVPGTFLQGCGLPAAALAFMQSIPAAAPQFHSSFLSYADADREFADRLLADLQSNGVRCWPAPEDFKFGGKFRAQMDESVHLQDRLLLVLSKHSIESGWVEQEIGMACKRERRDKHFVLFPIRLDNAVMDNTEPWVSDLRQTRRIADFTGWDAQDSYRKAFDRLLRDLSAPDTQ